MGKVGNTLPVPGSKWLIHTLPRECRYGFGHGYWVPAGIVSLELIIYTVGEY